MRRIMRTPTSAERIQKLGFVIRHVEFGVGPFTVAEALSPRRVYRRGMGVVRVDEAELIAKIARGLLTDWFEAGFPRPPMVHRSLPQGTVYLGLAGPMNVYLTIKELSK